MPTVTVLIPIPRLVHPPSQLPYTYSSWPDLHVISLTLIGLTDTSYIGISTLEYLYAHHNEITELPLGLGHVLR